jgi:predicted ATP-grasp superfamily ATP-dependent carboligase
MENALSAARSLGGSGVPVSICTFEHEPALSSRYCRHAYPIPVGADPQAHFADLLLGEEPWSAEASAPGAAGGSKAVVLYCSDDAIEFGARNHAALAEQYLLDFYVPEQQLALLDKMKTLELAEAVGCSLPSFWSISSESDLYAIKDAVVFPAMIKPIHSHVFQRETGKKFLPLDDPDDLVTLGKDVLARDLEFMVCEFVPGPDSLLCSYYTHIDNSGTQLFRFTKRVIRRSPPHSGRASFHATEWLPDVAAEGQRFFDGIGFRGMGNIEFKRDTRDGKLKVIEINARFTAAQELVTRAGIDMPCLIYRRLCGLDIPEQNGFREHLYLWYPGNDFDAFRDLRRTGDLTFVGWLKSVLGKRIVFPYFRLSDPLPALRRWGQEFDRRALGRFRR